MEKYQSKETLHTMISSAALTLWGKERTETLQPVLEEVVDQLWQVTQFPLALDEEPAFFAQDIPSV